MSSPSTTSAVTRPDLKNRVYRDWDLRRQRAGFVANLAAPLCDVELARATIKRIDAREILKDPDDSRAAGGGYNRGEFRLTEISYDTVERGLEQPIDRSKSAELGGYMNCEREAADIVLYQAHAKHEKRVADLMQTAGSYGALTGAVNGVNWTKHTTADPIDDVQRVILALKEASGYTPNSVVIPWKAWNHMIRCANVLDRLGSGGAGTDPKIVTRAAVAKLLDLPETGIIVPDAYRATSNPGATLALGSIWDVDKVVVGYIDSNPDPSSRTLAVSYHWTGDGSQRDFAVETYYEEAVRADVVRARRHVAAVLRDSALGYLLTTVLTKA